MIHTLPKFAPKISQWTATAALALCALAQMSISSADETLRQREQRAMKAALARVAPSVVRIETVGGLERVGQVLIGTGPTTGLVVSADGYIVSSAFNFVQKPDSILVTLQDGSRRAARLVARDNSRMIVLLKIEPDAPLTVPEAAPRSEMRVGQWALAVGRTFEIGQPNLSVGIVSALDRIWSKAIQTDAKISPSNYGGPLVDISGRVLGVLVPMSPDGHGEMAGVEWYDSGIGFAIPLEQILRVLPKLEGGADLEPGLLGISLKGSDIYSQPAIIGAARATGPAYKAGLRSGDRIVEVAGHAISRAAELKHQLGPLYAGDNVALVALRGDERIERTIELVGKIDPYETPFLGVLPMRFADSDKPAYVVVRYVYPGSPAEAAGLKPGDRIKSLSGESITSAADVAAKLPALAPDQTVKLEVLRGDETLTLEAKLARLPESLPGDLPPARAALGPSDAERPEVGLVRIKAPEFENECVAYVPESYDPRVAYGVILWLHAPGGFKDEELIERWKPLCDKLDFVLVAPKATDQRRWLPTEIRFVRRALDEAMKRYHSDPARVVVHGHEAGGSLAYLVAMAGSDVVRAVAASEAPLPRMLQPPEVDPVKPLAIYTTLATKSESVQAVEAGIKTLRELKYPVVVKTIGEQSRYLTSDELAELVRWFDTLDRI